MSRPQTAPSREVDASRTLKGLLLATEKDGHDHVLHLCNLIDGASSDHARFSKLFAQLNSCIELDRGLGHGGFGTVLSCKVDGQLAALKFEVSGQQRPSSLEHEGLVYQSFSRVARSTGDRSKDPENPLPRLVRAFHDETKWFMSIPLTDLQAVKILCMEHLDLEPQTILRKAQRMFASEARIDSSFRYIALKLFDASVYLVQRGVIHLDLKAPHLAYRKLSRELVFLDWGAGELKGRRYQNEEDMDKPCKRAKCSLSPSFGLTGLSLTSVLPRFACDRPGTRGSRPPFVLDGTFDGSCRAYIWQLAVILFELFKPVPYGREHAIRYETDLYAAVKNFEAFKVYALGGESCPSATCRQCLELVYNLFQDALTEKKPIDIIVRARMSEFALAYIAENAEMERILSDEGLVVDGCTHANGKVQRPLVLLKVDDMGLLVLLLFDSQEGDPASPYCGRVVDAPSANNRSRASFCMHGLVLGNGKMLDGQPCEDLPLDLMISFRRVGSLFSSSRSDPEINVHGNVGLPDRLNPNALQPVATDDGAEIHAMEMNFRRNSRFGQQCSWSYKWGNGGGDIAIPRDKVEAYMRPRGRVDGLLRNEKIRNIVTKHRNKLLGEGRFADADWGQCRCDQGSLERDPRCPFLSFNFERITPVIPVQRPETGKVWVSPEVAEPRVIQELTVPAAWFDRDRFNLLLAGLGASLVSCLREEFPQLFANAESYARANEERLCKDSVFIYPARRDGSVDVGRGEKKLGYLNEKCATAQLLLKILALIRPGYSPVKATRTPAKPVSLLNLIRQLPPPADCTEEVQVHHVDTAVRGLSGFEAENGGDFRSNLKAVLDGNGPMSVFVPFDDGYYVIVYLTGNILVIECMKHFCRHYARAKGEYFRQNPESDEGDFRAVWCGGTVDYIRELYPDVQLEPVRIPVSKGNALAISSFLPHCGPPIPGLRGFILAGPEVLSDSQKENWRLLISPALLL